MKMNKEVQVKPAFSRQSALACICLAMAVLLLAAALAWGQAQKTTQMDQSLYPSPDFAGTPTGVVPAGSQVAVIRQYGDWYQVDYQGKIGWLHRQAFPQAKAASSLNLPGVLFGGPVKETRSDEVALAGKGFTPEVESAYRQKHPEAQFAQVDKVEAFRVDEAQLQAFLKEGGLHP